MVTAPVPVNVRPEPVTEVAETVTALPVVLITPFSPMVMGPANSAGWSVWTVLLIVVAPDTFQPYVLPPSHEWSEFVPNVSPHVISCTLAL